MAAVVPRRIYYWVYATLLGLALLTWGISYVHLGAPLSGIVALTWVFVGAGIAWLGHLLILTMSDYLTRATIPGW